ncbi:hypothetical protein NEOLI_004452 [Neolecta irregularis DAH-3]|uniref:Uncharacterized protein n=1 Tax=Neolecta irregularis (strain DAH-3) TaxID=1198029 RepID=A0A1U7LKI4_NEOID|nr:hypothetical protein NEOLI_004452 [Neolecta irregularis DAH-3]|eukprot:OLL23165.1 hypothetical protein NEOLI_004452 [Neolecta irregularis DAH-3]
MILLQESLHSLQAPSIVSNQSSSRTTYHTQKDCLVEQQVLKNHKIGSHLVAALNKRRDSIIPKPVRPAPLTTKRIPSSTMKSLNPSRMIKNVVFEDSTIKENIKPPGPSKIPILVPKRENKGSAMPIPLLTSKENKMTVEHRNALKKQFPPPLQASPVRNKHKRASRVGSHLASIRSRGSSSDLAQKQIYNPVEHSLDILHLDALPSPYLQSTQSSELNLTRSWHKPASLLSLPLSVPRPRNLLKRLLHPFKVQEPSTVPAFHQSEDQNPVLNRDPFEASTTTPRDEMFLPSRKAKVISIKEKLHHLDDIRGIDRSNIAYKPHRELKTKQSLRLPSICPAVGDSFVLEELGNWTAFGQDILVGGKTRDINPSRVGKRSTDYDDIDFAVEREFGI